jgi:acyl-CoA synthetase (AMP-forming)/AMP-acid ligase II
VGAIFVRGPQVAGEYLETGDVTGEDGWFATRDEGFLDAHGYLFVRGRADDTIIRGGENIAPAEIEEALLRNPEITDAGVVGIADEEWGQRIAAFVVPRAGARLDGKMVQDGVRVLLRSSRTPDVVYFVDALPYGPTGKLARRDLLQLAPVNKTN